MQKLSYTLVFRVFYALFKFVVYFSVFLVVRPPDVLCLPPSIVSKWRGLRELVLLPPQHRRLRTGFRRARDVLRRSIEERVHHFPLAQRIVWVAQHHVSQILCHLEQHGERATRYIVCIRYFLTLS